MKRKKYTVIKKINYELVELISSLFRPAISAEEADQIIWVVDLYEILNQTMRIKINELETALAHLDFKNFKMNGKKYYIVNKAGT